MLRIGEVSCSEEQIGEIDVDYDKLTFHFFNRNPDLLAEGVTPE
jgi:hypothetical protein